MTASVPKMSINKKRINSPNCQQQHMTDERHQQSTQRTCVSSKATAKTPPLTGMQESTGNTQQTQNTSSWASCTLAAAFLPSFIPFPLLSLYTSDGGACFVSSTFSVNVRNHHLWCNVVEWDLCVGPRVHCPAKQKSAMCKTEIHHVFTGENGHVLQRSQISAGGACCVINTQPSETSENIIHLRNGLACSLNLRVPVGVDEKKAAISQGTSPFPNPTSSENVQKQKKINSLDCQWRQMMGRQQQRKRHTQPTFESTNSP